MVEDVGQPLAAVAHALLRAPRRAVAAELPQVGALLGARVADQRAAEPAVVAPEEEGEGGLAQLAGGGVGVEGRGAAEGEVGGG